MPTLDENRDMWSHKYDWSQADSEWSSAWGSAETQWYSAILPRIWPFVPVGTILEIAPGFGRWTQFLVDKCERLILVDLSAKCIQACKERFGAYPHISYYVNDGTSLDFIPNESVDFVFSFDSLVHAEADVVEAYLNQLAGKLTKHGVGFIHHSNLGEHADYLALLRRFPYRLRTLLTDWNVVETFETQWRAASMTARRFEQYTAHAQLACIGQELINWQSKRLIDCISLVARENSRWIRANKIIRNGHFMREAEYAAGLARLYGKHERAEVDQERL